METVGALLADNITWHQSGNGPLSGDLAGKDAVFGNFAKLAELTGGTFGQEIHDMLANDEHAVVMVEQWWEQPHTFRGNSVHVWHVKDGIATAAWLTGQDQAAADVALTPKVVSTHPPRVRVPLSEPQPRLASPRHGHA